MLDGLEIFFDLLTFAYCLIMFLEQASVLALLLVYEKSMASQFGRICDGDSGNMVQPSN